MCKNIYNSTGLFQVRPAAFPDNARPVVGIPETHRGTFFLF